MQKTEHVEMSVDEFDQNLIKLKSCFFNGFSTRQNDHEVKQQSI
jgi:hypothetical protein